MTPPDSTSREKPNRAQVNFLVDFVALAGFVGLLVTGSVMRWVLPPGSGHNLLLWGMDRHQWGGIHFWVAVGLVTALILHVILHWRWIVSMMDKGEGASGRKILGILALAALVILTLAIFLTPTATIERGSSPGTQQHLNSGEGATHTPQHFQRRGQGPE